MDYSQFFNMIPEAGLIAVLVIVFLADLILKGEKKASDMNFETITEPGFYVNEKVAENLGVTVPQDLADEAVESFTEITK